MVGECAIDNKLLWTLHETLLEALIFKHVYKTWSYSRVDSNTNKTGLE